MPDTAAQASKGFPESWIVSGEGEARKHTVEFAKTRLGGNKELLDNRTAFVLTLNTSIPIVMVSCEGRKRGNKLGNTKKSLPVSCWF